MEIKPIVQYTLPKFALALTAAAVAGSMTACSLIRQEPVAIAGIAPQPVETDVVLMGDMPVVEKTNHAPQPTGEPDFSDAIDEANRSGMLYENEIREGFAQKNIELVQDDSTPLWVWRSTAEPQIVVGFFDGNARSAGYNARDYMAAALDPELDIQDWWGFIRVFPATEEEEELRIVYIDISRCEGLTIEKTAQIAEAVLNERRA